MAVLKNYAQEICWMRLHGMSIYAIANKFDVSSQAVYTYLKKFPKMDSEDARPPSIDNEKMVSICMDYLNRVPIPELARRYEITQGEVRMVLHAVRQRKPLQGYSPYYPKLSDWMRQMSCSTEQLAGACGEDVQMVRKVLFFGAPMSYRMAEHISGYTGLSFSEIFSLHVSQVMREYRKQKKEISAGGLKADG